MFEKYNMTSQLSCTNRSVPRCVTVTDYRGKRPLCIGVVLIFSNRLRKFCQHKLPVWIFLPTRFLCSHLLTRPDWNFLVFDTHCSQIVFSSREKSRGRLRFLRFFTWSRPRSTAYEVVDLHIAFFSHSSHRWLLWIERRNCTFQFTNSNFR